MYHLVLFIYIIISEIAHLQLLKHVLKLCVVIKQTYNKQILLKSICIDNCVRDKIFSILYLLLLQYYISKYRSVYYWLYFEFNVKLVKHIIIKWVFSKCVYTYWLLEKCATFKLNFKKKLFCYLLVDLKKIIWHLNHFSSINYCPTL